jgi:hypothetical protein
MVICKVTEKQSEERRTLELRLLATARPAFWEVG